MEKPVSFAYDTQVSGYSMPPSAVPPHAPQPLTPLTPISSSSDLPLGAPSAQYYRRESYQSSSSSAALDATPSSSGSSASYTSPSYTETVVSPATPEAARNASVSTAAPKAAPASAPTPTDYDTYSPLNGLAETESISIPQLMPPPPHLLNQDFDDFDSLPDLLRQDRKADYSPRRPMNIYFIYMRVRRPELALHNPNLSTGDLSKLLGKEWNSMSPDQKAPWNELAERLMRAFKKKFPDYQYERGGGKKALKKRPRSAPSSLTILNSNRVMVDAAASAAVRRHHHHHHHQMHPHLTHLPSRPLIESHPSQMWERAQAPYVYRVAEGEYVEYPQSAYPHTPVYATIPTPLSTPGLPPQGYPAYGYEYATGAPVTTPLSAPLEPHHMSTAQAQGAGYPFPMSSPGFAPTANTPSVAVANPPTPMNQESMGYYNQAPMYPPAPEASSPWDEYIVQ